MLSVTYRDGIKSRKETTKTPEANRARVIRAPQVIQGSTHKDATIGREIRWITENQIGPDVGVCGRVQELEAGTPCERQDEFTRCFKLVVVVVSITTSGS